MATLMKSTQPHWQGNKFIPVGTVLPTGHPEAIPEFFEVFEVDEPVDPGAELEALRKAAKDAGVKIDNRWGPDRLREEIAKAG